MKPSIIKFLALTLTLIALIVCGIMICHAQYGLPFLALGGFFILPFVLKKVPRPLPTPSRWALASVGIFILVFIFANSMLFLRSNYTANNIDRSSLMISVPTETAADLPSPEQAPNDYQVMVMLLISADLDDPNTTRVQQWIAPTTAMQTDPFQLAFQGLHLSASLDSFSPTSRWISGEYRKVSISTSHQSHSSGGIKWDLKKVRQSKLGHILDSDGNLIYNHTPNKISLTPLGLTYHSYIIAWLVHKDAPMEKIELSSLSNHLLPEDSDKLLADRLDSDRMGFHISFDEEIAANSILLANWLMPGFPLILLAILLIIYALPKYKYTGLVALHVLVIFVSAAIDFWAIHYSSRVAQDTERPDYIRMQAASQLKHSFFWQDSAQKMLAQLDKNELTTQAADQ